MGGQSLATQWQQRKMVCMVNDIIEEQLDLAMEPKPESLWWTSTHTSEDGTTLKVGNRGHTWDLPFREVFDVLVTGKALIVQSVPAKTKCHRVVSHVFSTALNCCVNWPWSVTTLTKVLQWDTKILHRAFTPTMNAREVWVEYRKRTPQNNASQMEEHGPADDGREERGKIWTTVAWAAYDKDVPAATPLLPVGEHSTRWRNRRETDRANVVEA